MDQMARTPQQIGAALRRQRRNLALSQSALSEKTRLRQATISAVEGGEPGTELKTLCDILAALDLELIIRPRTRSSNKSLEDMF